eukprot:4896522-Amphidinium_carterae.1
MFFDLFLLIWGFWGTGGFGAFQCWDCVLSAMASDFMMSGCANTQQGCANTQQWGGVTSVTRAVWYIEP